MNPENYNFLTIPYRITDSDLKRFQCIDAIYPFPKAPRLSNIAGSKDILILQLFVHSPYELPQIRLFTYILRIIIRHTEKRAGLSAHGPHIHASLLRHGIPDRSIFPC